MLSKSQVQHIAHLARLELSEKEIEKFTQELSRILDYVRKLGEVDTSILEPTSQVTNLENVMREDVIKLKVKSEKLKVLRDKLLKAVPMREGDYVKVRAVFE